MRGSRLRAVRPAHFVVLVAILLLAGGKAYRRVQLRRQSPFALWEFRAGMPFEAIEKSAFRQMRGRFTCNAVVPAARLCDLRVTGIPGRVRTLVDASGRVTMLQFFPDSASPAMREESRRVAAEWNLVRAGARDPRNPPDTLTRTTRWRSEDGRWSALMRHRRFAGTPDAVRLVDEVGLAQGLESTPLASLVLSLNDVVESRDVGSLEEVGEALATMLFGRATDPANETAAPSRPAAVLPLCEAEGSDPITPSDDVRLAGFDEATNALLDAAVAAVYPGARVVVGRGAWIVDSTGRSESVHLGRSDVTSEDGAAVFSLHFPGRSRVAAQRLEDGVAERYCRAPGLLLFAQRNVDGTLAEARLIAVDEESLASEVSSVVLSPANIVGDLSHIRVRYAAAYATGAWTGTLEWEAIIKGDPPRATARVPLMFQHRARDAEAATSGYLIVTGRPSGGVELGTVEHHDWGVSTRTFVVPLDSTGALLGARVLDRPF